MDEETQMATQSESQAELRTRYESFKEGGTALLAEGRLKEALEAFDRAHGVARSLDDEDLVDLAFCNRSAVALRLGVAGETVARLQEILLQTQNPQVATLAAYNLSRAYDRRKDFKKVIFYGRIALKYATDAGHDELRASALNQLGNAFASVNQFDAALDHYRQGLGCLGADDGFQKAHLLNNQGYALTVLGDFPAAFRSIYRSLRMFRRCASGGLYECEPHLTLSFAYLHLGRPRPALRHASRAFDAAERCADLERLKYALLLLGESRKLAGDDREALEYFELLQTNFYPQMPEVPGMLIALDVCKLINLKA